MQSKGRVSPTAIVCDVPSVTRLSRTPSLQRANIPTPLLLSGHGALELVKQGAQIGDQGSLSAPKSQPIQALRPVSNAHKSGIVGPIEPVYQSAWLEVALWLPAALRI